MSQPRVLVLTNMWPSPDAPTRGGFVQEQFEDVRAIVPEWEFEVMVIDGRRGRHRYAAAILDVRRRVVERGRPPVNLIHAHYGLTGAVAAFQRRVPFVVTYHGSDVYIPWQRRISGWAARAASANIFVSERLRARMGESGEVIPCGVDVEQFRPGGRRNARAALGIDAGACVVVFPGDPGRPVKGHALFREAVAALPPAVRDRVVELPLSGLRHDQVPLRLQAADAVLLTSAYEGAGTVAKEAVACGVPVVSVDVGDVPTVIGGVPGCAVVERDPRALAAALVASFREPPRTDGGRRIERLGMDHVAVARRVVEVYRRTMSARRGPAVAGA